VAAPADGRGAGALAPAVAAPADGIAGGVEVGCPACGLDEDWAMAAALPVVIKIRANPLESGRGVRRRIVPRNILWPLVQNQDTYEKLTGWLCQVSFCTVLRGGLAKLHSGISGFSV